MTYSIANLIAGIMFLFVAVVAIIRWSRIKDLPGTKSERDGMTTVAVMAGLISLSFFVAFLFVSAAEAGA